MVLDRPGQQLTERELPDPVPAEGQVLIEVSACAVCRTDLHIYDGELPEPKLPLVPGHMIVGRHSAAQRRKVRHDPVFEINESLVDSFHYAAAGPGETAAGAVVAFFAFASASAFAFDSASARALASASARARASAAALIFWSASAFARASASCRVL